MHTVQKCRNKPAGKDEQLEEIEKKLADIDDNWKVVPIEKH